MTKMWSSPSNLPTPKEVACGNGGSTQPDLCIQPVVVLDDRSLPHDNALSGTVGYCSGNGCIDITLFCQYLDHFIEHVRPTTEQKVLLMLDNHISHKSLEAIEKSR